MDGAEAKRYPATYNFVRLRRVELRIEGCGGTSGNKYALMILISYAN